MTFEELPVWARKQVVQEIQSAFPEMLDPRCLKTYLDNKDDFKLVDESEDGEEPEWTIIW